MRCTPSPSSCHPVARAVAALQRGEVIAYPTETVFGLGVDPFHPGALAALLRLKGRDVGKGLIVLVGGMDQLTVVIRPPSEVARRLMGLFWPGPLTLVLPSLPGLSSLLTGGGEFVAVRLSSARRVAVLMRAWGGPLVSTSANLSGGEPARDAATVRRLWSEGVAVVVPGWCRSSSLPSTVVRVTEGGIELLRPGVIPFSSVQAALAVSG
ncbi:MAG: threonylcarbamoyl-AMP synthase [Magnetococcales bacterium]|nr:threonylcarbamoyl-AMP synthase [Magnetococcales bacterium]